MKKKPEPRLLAAARRIARRMRTRARSQGARRRPEGAHWRRGPASDQALPSSTYLVRWPDAFRLRPAARARPARAGQSLCRVKFLGKCNPKKKLQEIPHPLKFCHRIINSCAPRRPEEGVEPRVAELDGAHSSRRRRAGGSSGGLAGPRPTDYKHLCSGPRPGVRVPRAPGGSRLAHPSDAEPPPPHTHTRGGRGGPGGTRWRAAHKRRRLAVPGIGGWDRLRLGRLPARARGDGGRAVTRHRFAAPQEASSQHQVRDVTAPIAEGLGP